VNDSDRAAVAERFSWVSEALHAAAAVSAAHRLGLLTALDPGPVRAEDVARDCHTDVRSTAILFEALAAMGLVESSDDGWFRAAVPELSTVAAAGASADLLVEAVRSGRAPLGCDAPAGATRVYPNAVTYLATLLAAPAEAVAGLLQGASRILDVGAGAAPWSLAIARGNPQCRVTALDLAGVLPVTRHAVGATGCADRFDYLSGDAFEVPLPPATYDLVLLGNLCHLFGGHANRRLFLRLRLALQEGGRIAVIDVMPSPDRATQRLVRLYAASLMTRTSGGGVHSEESYRAWLEEVGFHDICCVEASRTPPTSVVTGSA